MRSTAAGGPLFILTLFSLHYDNSGDRRLGVSLLSSSIPPMDHNTGSGNTLLMLSALGNQFQDSQPKVATLPEETVRDNL